MSETNLFFSSSIGVRILLLEEERS